jgi:hypothetical protein
MVTSSVPAFQFDAARERSGLCPTKACCGACMFQYPVRTSQDGNQGINGRCLFLALLKLRHSLPGRVVGNRTTS